MVVWSVGAVEVTSVVGAVSVGFERGGGRGRRSSWKGFRKRNVQWVSHFNIL